MIKGSVTWITGNSWSGKSTLADKMVQPGDIILDGDAMRAVWPGLGFTKADRVEQNMRIARMAKELSNQGFNVIVATICPYRALREDVQKITRCRFIYLPGGKEGKDYPYEQ